VGGYPAHLFFYYFKILIYQGVLHMNELATQQAAPSDTQQPVDSNYAQALVDVLQKNCNDHFAKVVQLEARIQVQDKQIENLVNENVKLKTSQQLEIVDTENKEVEEEE
jgi:hypothetical protein